MIFMYIQTFYDWVVLNVLIWPCRTRPSHGLGATRLTRCRMAPHTVELSICPTWVETSGPFPGDLSWSVLICPADPADPAVALYMREYSTQMWTLKDCIPEMMVCASADEAVVAYCKSNEGRSLKTWEVLLFSPEGWTLPHDSHSGTNRWCADCSSARLSVLSTLCSDPNHIRTASEWHPNHIRTTSEAHES